MPQTISVLGKSSLAVEGDGSLAMLAVKKNLPYVGLTFTQTHVPGLQVKLSWNKINKQAITVTIIINVSIGTTEADLLQERLEKLTFEEMQNPKSALFSNELCNLIKASKKMGDDVPATWLQHYGCINSQWLTMIEIH